VSSHRSTQPVDVLLAEMIEGLGGSAHPWWDSLHLLQRLVGDERLANAGQLAAAEPVPRMAELPYLRVKHLLYVLLNDELTLSELETSVDEAVRMVDCGGVVMRCGVENVVGQLALRIRGPIDEEFEEVAHGAA
jgi:hypothetical protein